MGSRIITGPANHRNRHFAGQAPPITPFVKIWQGVASKQPNVTVLRVATLEPSHAVNREAGSLPLFEVTDADARTAGHPSGRREPGSERCHIVRAFLERIAGRDQPPHLVEPERPHRCQTDVPVPGVGRIEGSAEQADARHTSR